MIRATATISIFVMLGLGACGVRGRPQPPLQPAELGRGQPTFKRATEEFRFENVPNPDASPEPTPSPAPKAKTDFKNTRQRNAKPSGDSN